MKKYLGPFFNPNFTWVEFLIVKYHPCSKCGRIHSLCGIPSGVSEEYSFLICSNCSDKVPSISKRSTSTNKPLPVPSVNPRYDEKNSIIDMLQVYMKPMNSHNQSLTCLGCNICGIYFNTWEKRHHSTHWCIFIVSSILHALISIMMPIISPNPPIYLFTQFSKRRKECLWLHINNSKLALLSITKDTIRVRAIMVRDKTISVARSPSGDVTSTFSSL